MRPLIVCLLLLTLAAGINLPARAQSPALEVTDLAVDYHFGDYISFDARLDPTLPVAQAVIIFRATGEPQARVEPVTLFPDGRLNVYFPVPANVLPPFATITYRYQVTLQDGSQRESAEFTFRYEDNRFAWSMLDGGALRIFWYEGDTAFGQSALDIARQGLTRNGELFQLYPTSTIDIYIYASAADLQGALGPGNPLWVAGHASPELGVLLVSIAPNSEKSQEMERQIPHELTHILLFQNLGQPAYNNLPEWLREGMPTLSEIYRNPDYPFALRLALQNGTLIPLSDLCTPFPQDASRAFLAYAQSGSFTRYLYETYGTSGLSTLLRAYADGLSCTQGTERAFNKPLAALESEWRANALGEDRLAPAIQGLAPYIALPLLLAIPALLIFVLGLAEKRN
ncbi:MAG: peptidase MA family metallohydrolase [Anaerolineales bacterium]